jgi:hypothetical protein
MQTEFLIVTFSRMKNKKNKKAKELQIDSENYI